MDRRCSTDSGPGQPIAQSCPLSVLYLRGSGSYPAQIIRVYGFLKPEVGKKTLLNIFQIEIKNKNWFPDNSAIADSFATWCDKNNTSPIISYEYDDDGQDYTGYSLSHNGNFLIYFESKFSTQCCLGPDTFSNFAGPGPRFFKFCGSVSLTGPGFAESSDLTQVRTDSFRPAARVPVPDNSCSTLTEWTNWILTKSCDFILRWPKILPLVWDGPMAKFNCVKMFLDQLQSRRINRLT